MKLIFSKSQYIIRVYIVTLLCATLFYSVSSWATGPRVTPSIFVDDQNQVYGVEYPPFVSAQLKSGGLCVEIVDSVFKQIDKEYPHSVLPVSNMVKYYLQQENALAAHSQYLFFEPHEHADLIFIPVVITHENFYYSKRQYQNGLPWNGNLSSLKNYTYGAYMGEPVKAFHEAGVQVSFIRAYSLIKKLESEQIDFFRMSELALSWIVERHAKTFAVDIKVLEDSQTDLPLYIVFNMKHPQGRVIAKQFKAGLKEGIEQGRYLEILKKYIHSPAQQQEYLNKLKIYLADVLIS